MMTVFAITANGKRMTMRLIDADALRNVFDAMHAIPGSSHFDHLVLLGIKNHIDEAPTIDAVPVVRCRECKNGAPLPEEARDEFSPGVMRCLAGRGDCDKYCTTWEDGLCDEGAKMDAKEAEENGQEGT